MKTTTSCQHSSWSAPRRPAVLRKGYRWEEASLPYGRETQENRRACISLEVYFLRRLRSWYRRPTSSLRALGFSMAQCPRCHARMYEFQGFDQSRDSARTMWRWMRKTLSIEMRSKRTTNYGVCPVDPIDLHSFLIQNLWEQPLLSKISLQTNSCSKTSYGTTSKEISYSGIAILGIHCCSRDA